MNLHKYPLRHQVQFVYTAIHYARRNNNVNVVNYLTTNNKKIKKDPKLSVSGGTIKGDLTIDGKLTNNNLDVALSKKVTHTFLDSPLKRNIT